MTPPAPAPSDGDKAVTVRRARVGSIDIYEVKDSELEILEKGGSAQTQLNFAIFLATLAFASITALATANFDLPIIQQTFLIVAVVGVLLSIYLFVQWGRAKTSVKKVIEDIRNRMDDSQSDAQTVDGKKVTSGNDPVPPPS